MNFSRYYSGAFDPNIILMRFNYFVNALLNIIQGNSIYFSSENKIFINNSGSRAALNIVFFADTPILGLCKKIQGSFPKDIQVQRGIGLSCPWGIFMENNIQALVKLVFYRPMLSCGICKFIYIRQGRNEIPCKLPRPFSCMFIDGIPVPGVLKFFLFSINSG